MSVGIDLERLDTLDRFDHAAVVRAGQRLLGVAERRWCANQASLAQAVIVIFCCREAAFKCHGNSATVLDLALVPTGDLSFGEATLSAPRNAEIAVAWRVVDHQVLAIAASGPSNLPSELLRRVSGSHEATVF
ncbi:MAG TPA: 4'-phosphopantetheinyl transferase superfamily protein [Gemmatimonadales bacterium]|jgi:hypothetical protein